MPATGAGAEGAARAPDAASRWRLQPPSPFPERPARQHRDAGIDGRLSPWASSLSLRRSWRSRSGTPLGSAELSRARPGRRRSRVRISPPASRPRQRRRAESPACRRNRRRMSRKRRPQRRRFQASRSPRRPRTPRRRTDRPRPRWPRPGRQRRQRHRRRRHRLRVRPGPQRRLPRLRRHLPRRFQVPRRAWRRRRILSVSAGMWLRACGAMRASRAR